MKAHKLALLVAIAALASAGAATAHEGTKAHDTSARSTLKQTITGDDPGEGFSFLRLAPGEPYVVRSELGKPKPGRAARRKSLSYFGQLTDFQIPDEESPARVEFLDDLPGEMTGSAWRPQEAMVAHSVETSIRQLNHFLRSTVRQGDGSRASLDLAVLTGDLADNMQRNETQWVLRLLEGGTLDPSSGTTDLNGFGCPPIGPGPGGAEQAIHDYKAPRNYTGVQDYRDYYEERSYYDPNKPLGPTFGAWPKWTGLMDRAQVPFRAQGLKVPSYVLFGNHDSLAQGTEDAIRPYEDVATGCLKPLVPAFGDKYLENMTPAAILALPATDPSKIMRVPRDERRQYVDKRQFMQIFKSGQRDQHGFAFVNPSERRASRGSASYYAWSPKPGLRFVSLDTVSEGGNVADASAGNLDDPQFRWLKAELRRAKRNGQLVVAFGHHAIGSLTAQTPDEAAPQCTVNDEHGHDVNPGCDRDPRLSTPLHGGSNLKELFLSHRNVIAYVAGHSHENRVQPFSRAGGGGFWEIKSPAIADWPPQHRLIEVMDNRDGTLSIFGTMLDHDSPSRAPSSGTLARAFDPSTLASVGRTLTWNDPDQDPDDADGERSDRNVELLLRDPRGTGAASRPSCTKRGTSGNDIIRGTSGDDVICAGGGNDIVYGGGGNDTIYGAGGDDVLRGEAGNDRIFGGAGDDVLRGGPGDDRLSGGDGDDEVIGGDGNDRLRGGPGRDVLSGQEGRDYLNTRDNRGGNDVANGGPGNDSCDIDRGDTRSSC